MSPTDDPLEQFKATFFAECSELLAEAEARLEAVRNSIGNLDVEDLHAIFRSVHSVKGGAGAFEFTELIGFAHVMETVLDKLRTFQIEVTLDLCDLLLSSNDHIATLVDAARDGTEVDSNAGQHLLDQLSALISDEVEQPAPEPVVKPIDSGSIEEHGWGLFDDDEPAADGTSDDDGPATYRVRFEPDKDLFRFANEPLLLLRELSGLGEATVTADCGKLPSLADLDPELSYLSWDVTLVSECGEDRILEVFEFVEDSCKITITRDGQPGQTIQGEEGAQSSPTPPASEAPAPEPQAPAAVASTAVAQPAQTAAKKAAATPPAAAAKQASGKPMAGGTNVNSIRVDLNRVDRLVNMVGELVITQAMMRQQILELPAELTQGLHQGFEDLSMHTRELQESVMAVRMQPVKSVFSRMPRLVRDLSTKLNKKVQLEMSGEATEVDKTVIEQLSDPLTHMIRNALDHGIEKPEDRLAAGKDEVATIHLGAGHRGGRIEIVISDNGQGINRQKVLDKAIEKGVVSGSENLTDEQVDELIFAPGFSTADQVTDVSGRGVGMDVVRRNIMSLGGRISVRSEPGKGSRFLMTLPLTLAVLDGMVVACGEEKYIIPLTSILESIRPMESQLHRLSTGAEVIAVRGDYIRLIRLHELFGIPGANPDPHRAIVVIVEIEGGEPVGVLVDELLGQQQVVIKSLEDNYDPVPGISAATILGNGRVALILDIDGLSSMAQSGKFSGRRMEIDAEDLKLIPTDGEADTDAADAVVEQEA